MQFIPWDWTPKERVGPFEFHASIEPVRQEYGLILLEPDSETDTWDTYIIPEYESRVYAENGKITDVGCNDKLIYQGKNLLGRTVELAKRLFGDPDEVEHNDGPVPSIYQYERFGLMLFVIDQRIDSASCAGILDDN